MSNSHYFVNDANLASKPRLVKFNVNNIEFAFESDIGVFSKNELDFGSRLLIETLLPIDLGKNILIQLVPIPPPTQTSPPFPVPQFLFMESDTPSLKATTVQNPLSLSPICQNKKFQISKILPVVGPQIPVALALKIAGNAIQEQHPILNGF